MRDKIFVGIKSKVIQGTKNILFYIMILSTVGCILGNVLTLYARKYIYREETKVIYELNEAAFHKDIGLSAKIKKF